jgi:hypothetical protein
MARRRNTMSVKPALSGKPVEVAYEIKNELSEETETLSEKKMINGHLGEHAPASQHGSRGDWD